MANAVVFDVGGTKIASTVINDQGDDLLRGRARRFETLERAEASAFIASIVAELRTLEAEYGDVVAWGAAYPGPYKRLANGQLQAFPTNIPGMRGRSLEAEMAAQIPEIPGIVDNDLKLALWGEHLIGSLRGAQNAIGFVHSTGVGVATMIDGAIVRGPDNNAGEVRCVPVEFDQRLARPCEAQDTKVSGHFEGQVRGPMLAEVFFGVDRYDKVAVRAALEGASESAKRSIVEYCVPYVVSVLAPVVQATSATRMILFGSIASWLGEPYCAALASELQQSSETFRADDGSVQLASSPQLAPLVGAAHQAFIKAGVEMKLPLE